jgi:hypothetical protein
MRLSIRYQLLLPLLALMLGVVGMSAWTAWSSAQRARRQIETQMRAIADTEAKVSIPLNAQTLRLMKGLSSADFLVCDDARQPIVDDLGRAMTTLPALPGALPAPAEATEGDLGAPVVVAGTPYFVRGVSLQHGAPPARRRRASCTFSIPRRSGATRCGRRCGRRYSWACWARWRPRDWRWR